MALSRLISCREWLPENFSQNWLLQLNRFLLIYWLVVTGWRIVMQLLLLLEIFFLHILDNSQYELLYTFLEVLDFGEPLPQHTSFKNNVRSIFSGSPCERLPGCEPVPAAESARPQQLLTTAERSVIVEIILSGFVFNLLRSHFGPVCCCCLKNLSKIKTCKKTFWPSIYMQQSDSLWDLCDVRSIKHRKNAILLQKVVAKWTLIATILEAQFFFLFSISDEWLIVVKWRMINRSKNIITRCYQHLKQNIWSFKFSNIYSFFLYSIQK